MSGLEALGVACNIFQVISFGHETLSLCKRVYRDGSPCPSLSENAALLGTFSNRIQSLVPSTKAKRSKDEQQLIDVASACRKVASDLQEEISFIVGHTKKGSLATTLKIAAKTNWRKRRLDTLERKLGDAQKLMETGLLIRICDNVNVMSLDIESLDEDLQAFIEQYKNGQRELSGLLSREALDTRNHITTETTRAEVTIKDHVSDESRRTEAAIHNHLSNVANESSIKVSTEFRGIKSESRKAAQRDRLLNSLKFPSMNERLNQVGENHESTFRWIFEEREQKEIDEDVPPKAQWDSFPTWLRSDGAIYWISGKAGSGKTTLLKYLRSHPETRSSLDAWRPGASIISHFFWRPGNPMQRNTRGFLCSTLYQLLEGHEDSVDYVLRKFDGVASKDSYTDWSIQELRKAYLGLIRQSNKPVFLFIDGIDEIDTQEGICDLLELVNQTNEESNIKMCLSSRPEKLLRDQLQHHPQLHTHNLTAEDLHSYVSGSLRFSGLDSVDINQLRKDEIMSSLVEKADGVFLWLVLAVNSINRGLSNGDGYTLLKQRIDSLPGDLISWYKDMWERMKEDRDIYRRQAATYFNLVIACKSSWVYGPQSCLNNQISVLEMAFASDPPHDDFFSSSTATYARDLIKQSKNTERSLQVCCASFLEISDNPNGPQRWPPSQFSDAEFGPIHPYMFNDKIIRFVHRTAFDFMVNTTEGQEIIGPDTVPLIMHQLNILKANLAVRRIFLLGELIQTQGGHRVSVCNGIESILRDLSEIMDEIEFNGDLKNEAQLLIRLCENVYTAARPYEQFPESHDHFLIRAAAYNLGDYVPLALTERHEIDIPKGGILWSACNWPIFNYSLSKLKLIRRLLDHGCDPQAKNRSVGLGQVTFKYESSFSTFLNTLTWFVYGYSSRNATIEMPNSCAEEIRMTIDAFVFHGANLYETACVTFALDDKRYHWPVMRCYRPDDARDFLNNGGLIGGYCIIEFPVWFLIKVILKQLDMLKVGKCEVPFHISPDAECEPGFSNCSDWQGYAGSRVIALRHKDYRGGSFLKVTEVDSRYLASEIESWLIVGAEKEASTARSTAARWREVCERSERGLTLRTALAEFGYTLPPS